MPALLGYLIALAVFLGSGYAGLEWLASPDDPTTYQRQNDKASSANKHSGPKKSAAVADVSIKAERSGPSTAANAEKAGRDEAKATDVGAGGENLKAQKPDAVPTGGCMPIGLTADGEMVFPLQCRELIEHQRDPVASSPLGIPAPSQNGAQNSGKRNETTGNAVDDFLQRVSLLLTLAQLSLRWDRSLSRKHPRVHSEGHRRNTHESNEADPPA